MTVQEAYQRGSNLATVAVVSIAALAFSPEMITEDEMLHKVDDALLFILALVAIWWYRRARNRFQRTITPVLIALAAVIIKFGAVLLEMHDAADVGDDIGGLIVFLLAFILAWWLYSRRQPNLEA